MKKIFFILLVFISFQGFAQESVKLTEIGLEIMKIDLGEMNWYNAKKACDTLGDGWRLPTKDELKDIYKYKDFIGGFKRAYYWSSTDYLYNYNACIIHFTSGDSDYNVKDVTYYVRAVRNLK